MLRLAGLPAVQQFGRRNRRRVGLAAAGETVKRVLEMQEDELQHLPICCGFHFLHIALQLRLVDLLQEEPRERSSGA